MSNLQIINAESAGPTMAEIDILLAGCYLVIAIVALIAMYRVYRIQKTPDRKSVQHSTP